MKYSKNILLSFLFLVIYIKQVNSQSCKSSSGTFPSKCFEITSILVDACDNSGEGRSEMVWLAIGNNPLLVSDFSVPAYVSGNVNWGSGASNSWRGFCNYTSPMLSKLSQINTAISNAGNCGVLIPKGYSDTLPARSNVLIITSSDFNSTFSFDNLNDTLYVILQTAGNTTGHFANYGSGTRRLIIHNNSCGDTVTYNRGDLVNQSGSHASGDGALANFDFAGNDYYSNSGCSVPIDTSHLSINSINKSYCSGTSVALKSNLSKIQCFVWQSSDTNAGYFSDTTQANPSFNINQNFSGLVTIYLRGKSNCRTLVDSVVINVTSSGIAYAGRDTTLCSTVNIPLNGDTTGVGGIKWLSTGQGSFSNDTLLNPIYTPAASDTGGIWLMIRLKSSCATTLDSMFYLVTQVNMKIDAGHDSPLCPNNSLQLYGNPKTPKPQNPKTPIQHHYY
ncbi:MAG: hypothetical protein HYZ42_03040 [Bacteroidetes bacterium]|nr:hypothetical protein [Bacteroidota bacterium]